MPPEEASAPRPFWSGTLSFGLVSVPVDLYSGLRSTRLSMRMLAPDGTPLIRRYFCPEHDRELSADEIVRGHEHEPGEIVVVTDEELDALEPEKSRDIELRVFVPREQIPPLYLDRSYFLTPSGDSIKAYRLLAQTMQETGRAGVASFVMRGKEYLVAIFAENGILRAQTLRFEEEVRSPGQIGLPERRKPPAARMSHMKKQIRTRLAARLDDDDLADRDGERLRELVQAEDNVVEAPDVEGVGEAASATVVDLMAVLKQKLQGGGAGRATRGDRTELEGATREELYERAREADIPGRSKMSKRQLIAALRAQA